MISSLDPRRPMVFDTRSLGRRAGIMEELSRTVPAPDDLGTEVIAVRPGSDLHLDLRLESVLEGVLASGTVRGVAVGTCVRCLDELSIDVDAEFQELFCYPDRASHHVEVGAPEDEESLRLDGDLLDLEPIVRDALVPALPFQPVCTPDCPGLCDRCGLRLTEDPDHHHDESDPRWAALAALRGDDTEPPPEAEAQAQATAPAPVRVTAKPGPPPRN